MGTFGSIIKSLQRGTGTMDNVTSLAITIAAVVMAKTEILCWSGQFEGTAQSDRTYVSTKLTSTTNITATRGEGTGGADAYVEWQAIEYY